MTEAELAEACRVKPTKRVSAKRYLELYRSRAIAQAQAVMKTRKASNTKRALTKAQNAHSLAVKDADHQHERVKQLLAEKAVLQQDIALSKQHLEQSKSSLSQACDRAEALQAEKQALEDENELLRQEGLKRSGTSESISKHDLFRAAALIALGPTVGLAQLDDVITTVKQIAEKLASK